MTLLDDLNAIDVSAVVDAKAIVSIALQNEDLQKLLSDGPALSVLGDLGDLMAAVEGDFSEPEAFVAPLLGALVNVADAIEFDNADITQAVNVVTDGAGVLATALGGLTGDLGQLKAGDTNTIADRFAAAADGPGDFAQKAVGAIARHRHLLDLADNGMPRDPAALAEIALDILLPFPRDVLSGALTELHALRDGIDNIGLPNTRFTGVLEILAEIKITADAGDAAGLQAALDRLATLRTSTIEQIGEDIRLAGQALNSLGLNTGVTAVCDILDDLKVSDIGAIEDLQEWRGRILGSASQFGNLDIDVIRDAVDELFNIAETELVNRFETAIDGQVVRLENWLRGLLAELPIADLRNQLTAVLQDASDKIEGAGIDGVAKELRAQIANLSDLIGSVDLQALIDTAAQALADALAQALDQIEAALGTITDQINAIAAQVQSVLERATEGVTAFGDAISSVTQLIEEIDITAAAEAVIAVLSDLREKAEELLSAVPLPDALRDEVGKFTAEVAAIDVEGLVRQPLMAAVEQLQIPDEVGDTIDEGLGQIADIVANLIPENMAAELQGELDGLFEELESIDLSSVLGGIGDELNKLADVLGDVEIIPAIAPAQDAFDEAVRVLNLIKPSLLLTPVIRAYDDVMGALPLPDPQTIAERAGETVSAVGEPIAQAATEPARALAGADDTPPEPAATPVTQNEPLPDGVRPGDIIRLIGYLPAKLKEGLDALEAGPAGETMTAIHKMCGGFAADIRTFQGQIVAVENQIDTEFDAMLLAVTTATTEAKVALQASAAVTAGPVDAEASLSLVASFDATRLRNALAADLQFFEAQTVRVRRSITGPVMAKLDQVADVLEACALARIGDDLDALLDAIDPEDIAVALDNMFAQTLTAVAAVVGDIEADLHRYQARLMAMIARFNPGTQAQKFLRALNVLKEQFDLINPRRLANELDEVHQSLLRVFRAYAPNAFATELDLLITQTAATLRSLDPANLTPNFAPVEAQVARVPALLPIAALEGVGTELDALGGELAAIDIGALMESINTLTPQIVDAVEVTAEGIQSEILALLGAIQYSENNAGASGGGSVNLGGLT